MIILIIVIVFFIFVFFFNNTSILTEGYSNNERETLLDLQKFALHVMPELGGKITVNIGRSSLTEGKQNIFICIYDENKNIYDKDILYNVLLHELAHVISPTISGTDTTSHDSIHFNNVLRLNEKAKSKGYNNIDINVVPASYCLKKF